MRLRNIMTKRLFVLTLLVAAITVSAAFHSPYFMAGEQTAPEPDGQMSGQQRDDAALQQQVQSMIEKIDSIATAQVVFCLPDNASLFRRPFRQQASVLITTTNGKELPHTIARAIRALVAHAKGGMQEEDVVLVDQAGRRYGCPVPETVDETADVGKSPADGALALIRRQDRLSEQIASYDEVDSVRVMLPLLGLRENLDVSDATRAIINVTTRNGKELSRPLQEQIRKLVASSCENLHYEEVMIVDERNRRYYGALGLAEVWRDPRYGWEADVFPLGSFPEPDALMGDALRNSVRIARVLGSGYILNSDFCFATPAEEKRLKERQIPFIHP